MIAHVKPSSGIDLGTTMAKALLRTPDWRAAGPGRGPDTVDHHAGRRHRDRRRVLRRPRRRPAAPRLRAGLRRGAAASIGDRGGGACREWRAARRVGPPAHTGGRLVRPPRRPADRIDRRCATTISALDFVRRTGLPWDCQASVAKLLWFVDDGLELDPRAPLAQHARVRRTPARRRPRARTVVGVPHGPARPGDRCTVGRGRRRTRPATDAATRPPAPRRNRGSAAAPRTSAGYAGGRPRRRRPRPSGGSHRRRCHRPRRAVQFHGDGGRRRAVAARRAQRRATRIACRERHLGRHARASRHQLAHRGCSRRPVAAPSARAARRGDRRGRGLRSTRASLTIESLPAGLDVSGAGPTGDDVVLRVRDGAHPAAVWTAATRYTARETGALLDRIEAVVGPHSARRRERRLDPHGQRADRRSPPSSTT